MTQYDPFKLTQTALPVDVPKLLAQIMPIRMVFKFSGNNFESLWVDGFGQAFWNKFSGAVFYTRYEAQHQYNLMYGVDGSVAVHSPMVLIDGEQQALMFRDMYKQQGAFTFDPLKPEGMVVKIDWLEWLSTFDIKGPGLKNVSFQID
jgi:hypothetical protein